MLPGAERHQREAIKILYGLYLKLDDIADNESILEATKSQKLDDWREQIRACYDRNKTISQLDPVRHIIFEYKLPSEYLLSLLEGISFKIHNHRFNTVKELCKYCHCTGVSTSLSAIRILGCTHPKADEYAESLGYAVQCTSILYNVAEDYNKSERVYIPLSELQAFGVGEEELAEPTNSENCRRLFKLCHYRCKHYFNKSKSLLPFIEQRKLKPLLMVGDYYEAILDKIALNKFRLKAESIQVSGPCILHGVRRKLKSIRKPPQSRRSNPGSVLVWGGGIAGITAAIKLGYQGYTPILLEAKTYLGGRAHSLLDKSTGLTLDNSAHIAMGCYKSFIELIEAMGVADKFSRQSRLSVPYVSPGGAWSELAAKNSPAPLHLLFGLFSFSALSIRDQLAITKLMLNIRLGVQPADGQTALGWLQRSRQTPNAIKTLWEPFCLAALNEPLETACAKLLQVTIQRTFLGAVGDSTIYLPNVGLTEVFEPETQVYLQAIGGEVRKKTQIKSINSENGIVNSITTSKGERIDAEKHVCALPWTALRSLLPPNTPFHSLVSSIASAPILSIHILTNENIFSHPTSFVGLLNSSIHWIFDRTDTLPPKHNGKFLYSIVISAAQNWLNMKSQDVLDKLIAELKRYFPLSEGLKIERSFVYKSRDATFRAQPITSLSRPNTQDSPWKNVWLAGDWTQTGLPATIESASISGEIAVNALVRNG